MIEAMDSNLDSLAKTLASRLKFELCPHEMKMNSQLNCVKCVEAVIREAIDKTLEESIRKIRAFDKDDVSSDRGIGYDECIAAIRSLKQSDSGMEVRK